MTPGYGFGYGYGLGVPKAPTWTPAAFDTNLKAWYRPEDLVNPNQLRYTGDLENGVWVGTGITVTTGLSDPDGGNNAFKLSSDGSLRNFLQIALTFQAGEEYTGQVWAAWGVRGTNAGFLRINDGVGTTDQAMAGATWAPYDVTRTLDGAATKVEMSFIIPASTDWVVYHPQLEVGSIATEYQENGSTPGGLINNWPDTSDNNDHLTQVTQAKMPLVVLNALDGYAGGDFDGIDDLLLSTSVTDIEQPFTLVLVTTIDGPPAKNEEPIYSKTPATSTYIRYVTGSDKVFLWSGGSLSGDNGGLVAGSQYVIATCDGASSAIEMNGDINLGALGTAPVNDGFYIGGEAAASNFTGRIIEAFFVDKAFSAAERANAIGYLGNKFPSLTI